MRATPKTRLIISVLAVIAALVATSLVSAGPAAAIERPHAGTTGVPEGKTLKKHVGDLVITKSGTVIDGYDIYGNVTVEAPNVTIIRTRIRGTAAKVQRDLIRAVDPRSTGLQIVDSTVRPDTPTVYQRIGIRLGASDQLVLRTEVASTVDGIRIAGDRIKVKDSWLHDFRHYSSDPEHSDGSHDDAIQIQGGSQIRIITNSISGASNAAIMVGQALAPISEMRINGNYLDGGACTVNIAKKAYSAISETQLKWNRYGRSLTYAKCPVRYTPSHVDMEAVSNIWDNTGQKVPMP